MGLPIKPLKVKLLSSGAEKEARCDSTTHSLNFRLFGTSLVAKSAGTFGQFTQEERLSKGPTKSFARLNLKTSWQNADFVIDDTDSCRSCGKEDDIIYQWHLLLRIAEISLCRSLG